MGKQTKKKVNDKTKIIPEGIKVTDASYTNWNLSKCIGKGGFGLIYLANLSTNKDSSPKYVIKMENSESGPLFCEKQVYIRTLNEKKLDDWRIERNLDFLALPRYIGFGTHVYGDDNFRFLVMDKFGPDLQTRIDTMRIQRLPAGEVYRISTDMINALEYLHEHEYVHADIKASNMLLSLDKPERYVLADFGLSFRYMANGCHKKYVTKPKKAHNGTIEFTSQDAHLGADPSRRGDLEILGFCMVRWLSGVLPWDNVLGVPSSVAEMKKKKMKDLSDFMKTCFTDLVVPKGLKEYFVVVEALQYTEKPDYDRLKNLLSDSGLVTSKTSKAVKPLRPSSKRKRVEEFLGTDSDMTCETTESMNTEEYFKQHPSADIKKGRRVYNKLPYYMKRNVEIQVNTEALKNNK